MRRWAALLLSVLFPVMSLVACRGEPCPPWEMLSEVLATVGEATPAGEVFYSSPSCGGEGRALDETLLLSLYGREDGYCEYEGRVECAAVFLSSGDGAPYLEIAVFLCYGSADTRPILEMCLRRARLVSSLGFVEREEAVVVTSGRLVLFCLASDGEVRERVEEKYGK